MGISSRDMFSTLLFSLLSLCFCTATMSRLVSSQLPYVPGAPLNRNLRPAYHFLPPKNYMNGPMYYKGFYHLFYQYSTTGPNGTKEWGHSVSVDLINWIPLESAIIPSEPFDRYGCFTGLATILLGNKPTILYTGVIDPEQHQVQNIAYPKDLSDPYLREWVKPDYNPVITPSEGINGSSFRDPSTAWLGSDNLWRTLVGTKLDAEGRVIMYKSSDFVKWMRVENPLYSANGFGILECPDFYPVSIKTKFGLDTSNYGKDTKQVLKASLDLLRNDWYTIGVYDSISDTYTPDGSRIRFDYGNFYTSKSFYDPIKKRRIVWGWTNESDSLDADRAKGWSGIQAIPRAIWLDPKGKQLVQWPVDELNLLRGQHVSLLEAEEIRRAANGLLFGKIVKVGDHFEVNGIQTAQADVEVTFKLPSLENAEQFDTRYQTDAEALCGAKSSEVMGGVGPFGLLVLASSNLEEKTAVFFRVFKAENKHVLLMCNDPTRSSLAPDLYKPTFASFVDIDLANTSEISLRTLVDHSVVESFGAGGIACITSRVYPTLAVGDDAHLLLFNNGSVDIKVSQLDAWEMKTARVN